MTECRLAIRFDVSTLLSVSAASALPPGLRRNEGRPSIGPFCVMLTSSPTPGSPELLEEAGAVQPIVHQKPPLAASWFKQRPNLVLDDLLI